MASFRASCSASPSLSASLPPAWAMPVAGRRPCRRPPSPPRRPACRRAAPSCPDRPSPRASRSYLALVGPADDHHRAAWPSARSRSICCRICSTGAAGISPTMIFAPFGFDGRGQQLVAGAGQIAGRALLAAASAASSLPPATPRRGRQILRLAVEAAVRSSTTAASRCTVATASRPVTAVTRRTPLATTSWLTILKKPAWPVWLRCVPPQNSTESSSVASSGLSAPISSTRTGSGYFSPKTARTPGDFLRLRQRHRHRRHRQIGVDLLVDQPLDLGDFLRCQRLVVREVEARLVGIDQRALLLDVLAEHLAQRPVEQVRRGVVAHGVRR